MIHVWQPAGYRSESAGLVLYQHGYTNSAERSWQHYYLAPQFRASRLNALFVVADGPRRRGHALRWPNLDALLAHISAATKLTIPKGEVIAIGHSAGFRSLSSWREHPRLKTMILLDGLYGREKEFSRWLRDDETRRIMMVASDTRRQSEAWVRTIPFAEKRKSIPLALDQLSEKERGARLLYFRSQFEHSQMVRVKWVVPMLLKLGPLKSLPRPAI